MSSIITALDYAEAAPALALARLLDPAGTRLKVGNQLFTAAGPALVETLQQWGFEVFLDLKFHDIPNTVAAAVASAEALGVWMVNVHAGGGARMLDAARHAVRPVADGGSTHLIAVTVLTSFDTDDLAATGVNGSIDEQVVRLSAMTQASGCDGVVCSVHEVAAIRATVGADLLTVTPGIRPAAVADDQRRVVTPTEAVHAGVDYMVIGRPITRADDPQVALERILREVGAALAHPSDSRS